tara:strand:+ start:177 stop:497 length:321 start_codon:yes stop_codon:yes gene_type:complete
MSFKLNIIDREGNKTIIDIAEGTTIKDAIEDVLSPDNYGICGGCCACGACHVYIQPSDFDKLTAKEDEEITTLKSLALEPNQYSRLGCQVEFKKEYNNITLTIAPD